jgi:hypothetical protein
MNKSGDGNHLGDEIFMNEPYGQRRIEVRLCCFLRWLSSPHRNLDFIPLPLMMKLKTKRERNLKKGGIFESVREDG